MEQPESKDGSTPTVTQEHTLSTLPQLGLLPLSQKDPILLAPILGISTQSPGELTT